jgi:septum formation inhibitor-activating ATPase MinD
VPLYEGFPSKNLENKKRIFNLAKVFDANCLTNYLNFTEMKELVNQIKAEYEVFVTNADAQVEKGNKAAGARARKAALNLMKAMKDFRKASVEATK